MANHPEPCARQQELSEKVRSLLLRLAELASADASAIAKKDEKLWTQIDKQIEDVFGEKERALGALREHRKEHGC